jgi:hypothetical protein
MAQELAVMKTRVAELEIASLNLRIYSMPSRWRCRMDGIVTAMPDRDRPASERDCPDCGVTAGMKLQNVLGTAPTNIPLLYVCSACGCLLTIPPAHSPVIPSRRQDE